LYPGSDA